MGPDGFPRLLLVAQGDHGVHAHGSARRDVASEESDTCEQARNPREGERIPGSHSVDELRDEAGQGESGDDERARLFQPDLVGDDDFAFLSDLVFVVR